MVDKCDTMQLGTLNAVSKFFNESNMTERAARERVQQTAQGPHLFRCEDPSSVRALHAARWAARAEAQKQKISLGAFHTLVVAQREGHHSKCHVMASGRGFHGQLGRGGHDSQGVFSSPAGYVGQSDFSPEIVSSGHNHSVAVGSNGEAYAWGLASSGELGHGGWTPIDEDVPRLVRGLRVRSVSAGANHSLVIAEDGSLWACGRSRNGQLGLGSYVDAGSLQPVEALRGVVVTSVSAGAHHSACIDGRGNVWVWGEYRSGQLGLGLNRFDSSLGWDYGVPWPCLMEKMPSDEAVWSVSAGVKHTLFCTASGGVYATGSNSCGQLGVPGVTSTLAPVEISHMGKPCTRCNGFCRAVQVAAGGSHSAFLTSCGAVYAAGANNYGQLGTGKKGDKQPHFEQVRDLADSRIATVVAGKDHSGAVCDAGRVFLWGRGEWGQLGTGEYWARFRPAEVPGVRAQVVGGEEFLWREHFPSEDASGFPNVVHVRTSTY